MAQKKVAKLPSISILEKNLRRVRLIYKNNVIQMRALVTRYFCRSTTRPTTGDYILWIILMLERDSAELFDIVKAEGIAIVPRKIFFHVAFKQFLRIYGGLRRRNKHDGAATTLRGLAFSFGGGILTTWLKSRVHNNKYSMTSFSALRAKQVNSLTYS